MDGHRAGFFLSDLMMGHMERESPLVLVVDDEQGVLDSAWAALTASGLGCHCVATVAAAMTAAAANTPDLILADVSLDGTTGWEMCLRLRQNPLLAEVPVMFLSNAQGPDIIRRSDDSGGAYYLRKPFDRAVLVELVERTLRHGRAKPAPVCVPADVIL